MLRGRVLAGASVLACAFGAFGCAAGAVDDVADASSAMTQGLVVIERETSFDAEPQTSVSAKFMRLSPGVEPDVAERVVGARLELPAVGTCMPLPASSDVPPLAGRSSIELLDVGDVTVSDGEASRLPLAIRAFPDVGDLVSGVFYTTRDDAADLGDGSYGIAASGSPQVEGFGVSADAPFALEDVRFGDDALGDVPLLEAGRDVMVRWSPAAGARSEDRILVDVVAGSGAVVRCSFADTGEATLPGEALDVSSLGARSQRAPLSGALPASAAIEVHRVRRAFFGNATIDAGEVRFDLSVLGRATVARPE